MENISSVLNVVESFTKGVFDNAMHVLVIFINGVGLHKLEELFEQLSPNQQDKTPNEPNCISLQFVSFSLKSDILFLALLEKNKRGEKISSLCCIQMGML